TPWLPLIDALQDVTLEPAQQADSSRLQGLRVLLVDDAEEILEMLGSLCEMEGADVTTAANGLLALERLAEEDFDVLVSDLGMPTMDGYELLTRLRRSARNASIPAIALSGYGPSLK